MKKFDLDYIPTVDEMYSDAPELTEIESDYQMRLNTDPPKRWLREHPDFPGHWYLPIDKVEILLTRLQKRHYVEVLREGVVPTLGVYSTIRLHYWDHNLKEMRYHDGTAGIPCKTKGEFKSAFQRAKSEAIKDAAHHIGRCYGRDLNRVTIEMSLAKAPEVDKWTAIRIDYATKKELISPEVQLNMERIMGGEDGSKKPEETSYEKLKIELSKIKNHDEN